MLKKIMLVSATTAMIAAGAVPVQAQDNDGNGAAAVVGGTAIATTTGIATGSALGGPIGAVIGGFVGASLGAAATLPDRAVTYTMENPVEPVYFDSNIEVGMTVDPAVTLYDVPESPDYAYFYANGRVYIVEKANREIVYSPGYAVPENTIAYVESNPTASVTINTEGELTAGTQVPAEVQLTEVPDTRYYSYAYVNDRPVLVDTTSRTVIWVK